MQTGGIPPIIRQFFTGQVQERRSLDSQPEQGNGQQPEREPNREEAEAAIAVLLQEEEFRKQGLKAELKMLDGGLTILISDRLGTQLKAVRGREILRILAGAAAKKGGPALGRILDKRV